MGTTKKSSEPKKKKNHISFDENSIIKKHESDSGENVETLGKIKVKAEIIDIKVESSSSSEMDTDSSLDVERFDSSILNKAKAIKGASDIVTFPDKKQIFAHEKPKPDSRRKEVFQTNPILDEFLEKQEQVTLKSATKKKSEQITADDDVYILQCPKQIDINCILHQKIKFDGITNVSSENRELEVVTEQIKQPKIISVGIYNKLNQLKLTSCQPSGKIIIKEKLMKTDVSFDNIKKESKPQFPSNLKKRHPLFGFDYEEKINIPTKIRKLLEKRSHHIKKEYKKEKIDHKFEVISPKIEKSEKNNSKKRKISENEISDKPHSKNKKIKTESTEEISSDLQWIQNL